jgi:hypothetical protein
MKVSLLSLESAVLAFTLAASPALGQTPRRDPEGFDPADAALLTPRPGHVAVHLRADPPGRTVYIPASLRPEGDSRRRRDARPLCITPCTVYLRPGTTTFFTSGAPYDLVDVTVGAGDTEVVFGRDRSVGVALPLARVAPATTPITGRDVGRVALESLSAVVGAGLGGLLGGAVLFATGGVCLDLFGRGCGERPLAPLGWAAVILLPTLGAATGTYFVGSQYNRGGSFGWTLLGSAGGLGAATLLQLVTTAAASSADADADISLALGLSIGATVWIGMTVLAYELSTPDAPRGPNAPRPRAMRFGPTLTPTAHHDGATFGLVGVF